MSEAQKKGAVEFGEADESSEDLQPEQPGDEGGLTDAQVTVAVAVDDVQVGVEEVRDEDDAADVQVDGVGDEDGAADVQVGGVGDSGVQQAAVETGEDGDAAGVGGNGSVGKGADKRGGNEKNVAEDGAMSEEGGGDAEGTGGEATVPVDEDIPVAFGGGDGIPDAEIGDAPVRQGFSADGALQFLKSAGAQANSKARSLGTDLRTAFTAITTVSTHEPSTRHHAAPPEEAEAAVGTGGPLPANSYADLWDGFGAVSEQGDKGTAATQQMLNFMKGYADIHAQFSERLAKHCANQTAAPTKVASWLSGMTGNASSSAAAAANSQGGTLEDAWRAVLANATREAEAHERLALQIRGAVVEPTAAMLAEVDHTRRQTVMAGDAMVRQNTQAQAERGWAHKTYMDACEALYTAKELAGDGKPTPSTNDYGTQKRKKMLAMRLQKAQAQAEAAEREYQHKLSGANAFLEEFYSEKLPKVMAQLEEAEKKRLEASKDIISAFAELSQSLPKDQAYAESVDNLKAAVEKVDTDKDFKDFLDMNAPLAPRPQQLEFKPWTPDI